MPSFNVGECVAADLELEKVQHEPTERSPPLDGNRSATDAPHIFMLKDVHRTFETLMSMPAPSDTIVSPSD